MDDDRIERAKIMDALRTMKGKDIAFSEGRILGSMCTAPHPIALDAHMMFHESNLGNPGLCPGTAELEADVIRMLAVLFNGAGLYGKALSGGTEANITAMYMAKKRTGRRKVIFGKSAHFSVLKAVKLLDLEPVRIGLDPDYRMDLSELEDSMDDDVMLVHSIAGTTELGAVDDIAGIARVAQGVPIHVDAAFGGFVLPFMDAEHLSGMGVGEWDFRVQGVGTIAVDPHKMGLSTIPSGCLLYRDPSALDYLRVDSPYLTSPSSFTLAGTRGSGAVAATWAVMKHLGMGGYRDVVRTCMDNTHRLERRLSELGLDRVTEPTMNVLAVHHPDPVSVEVDLRKKGFFISTVRDPPALRFVVMPHVTERAIDAFIPVLEKVLRPR